MLSKLFYPRFAAMNIKKHSKSYIPYILSCIGMVMMHYILGMLAGNESVHNMPGGAMLENLLIYGSYIIAIFALIFLFYTNSFLVKRRKKEFGLFNILGMEKRHISRIAFFETLYIAVISIVIGLGVGILLSGLIRLLLQELLKFDAKISFEISVPSIVLTFILFGAIFLLTLFYTIRQIHLSKPVELLKSGQTGEKEPKTKWLLVLIGLICLGVGYYIALTTESPLDAILLFFAAAVLVMAGTYCLFTAGSIALLKKLRKNKNYYYKTKHFTSVSGMIYRMKQNAVGLANICILSTAVLIMFSTTLSLYLGMEDALRTMYPRNICVQSGYISQQQAAQIDAAIKETTDEFGVEQNEINNYRYLALSAYGEGMHYTSAMEGYDTGGTHITLMALDEYNRLEGQAVTLNPDEILLYELNGSVNEGTIQMGDLKYRIQSRLTSLNVSNSRSGTHRDSYYIIMPDSAAIERVYSELLGSVNIPETGVLAYYYAFDADVDSEIQIALTKALRSKLENDLNLGAYVDGVASSRESVYSLYGGLLLLGVFLGLLFIMATVLIIYYKQISEGFEDKQRFEIMQKVGMSRTEVKKSIKSQVLLVFFLPLGAAAIHIAASFQMIAKIMKGFNLANIPLFATCMAGTLVIFALLYMAVYFITAREYYKIVRC